MSLKEFRLPLTFEEYERLPTFVTTVCDTEAKRNVEQTWGEPLPTVLMIGPSGARWAASCPTDDIEAWLSTLVTTAAHRQIVGAALIIDLLLASTTGPEAGVSQVRAVVGALSGGELFTVLRLEDHAILEWTPDKVGRFATSYVQPLRELVNAGR